MCQVVENHLILLRKVILLFLSLLLSIASQNLYAPTVGWHFDDTENKLKVIELIPFDDCYVNENKCGTKLQRKLLEKYYDGFKLGKLFDIHKYIEEGCIASSPCFRIKANKVNKFFPKLKSLEYLEISINKVFKNKDELIFIFEINGVNNECHVCGAYWHYLRVEKIEHPKLKGPKWREAFYSNHISQYTGSYGRLGKFDINFTGYDKHNYVDNDDQNIIWISVGGSLNHLLIYDDGYLAQGVIENYRTIFLEKSEKMENIGSFTTYYSEEGTGKEEYTEYKSPFGFLESKSHGLPYIEQIIKFTGKKYPKKTLKKRFKYDGQRYKEFKDIEKIEEKVLYSEARVRYILADIAAGGPAGYYARFKDDAEAVEATKRHKAGVKVINSNKFDRVNLPGKGWTIVYTGTSKKIESDDVILSTDK